MLTIDNAPWIKYLEIDEKTRERKIKEDAPKEIRDMYEAHCLAQAMKESEFIPK